MRRFRFPQDGDIASDLRDGLGYAGDLVGIFTGTTGATIHKWHHYLPLYERYFAAWRGLPVRFLEIGVSRGGSLRMWREWFGPEAVIYGIDINPNCARHNGIDGQVRIGSQDDPAFLEAVVAEMGGIDLVLDDGSHQMDHVRVSLETLFPALAVGGTYMIEDLHTAYLARYGGGLKSRTNFYRFLGEMIDDMHHWYHGKEPRHAELAPWVTGLHVHDSIAVIEKAAVRRPVHSRVG